MDEREVWRLGDDSVGAGADETSVEAADAMPARDGARGAVAARGDDSMPSEPVEGLRVAGLADGSDSRRTAELSGGPKPAELSGAPEPAEPDGAPSRDDATGGATQLMPGGGKPAKTEEPAGPARGETLPMPQPGPRPDDPTHRLRGEADVPMAAAASDEEGTDEPLNDVAPVRASRRPRRWSVALAVIGVAAVIAGITALVLALSGPVVPDVTGLSTNDARARLKDAGFSAKVVQVPADDDFGVVVSSDPAAGQRARKGDEITVSVATPRVVPRVTGATADDAKRAMASAGITNLRLENKNSDEEAGTVIGVTPGEGTVVTSSDEVVVQVAQPYTVPDVVGLTQDDATKAIAEAGLQSKIEWREAEGTSRTVLSTSPAAGEQVRSGSTVTVAVVAPGPRAETYLTDYLSADSKDLSSYLTWKGWKFTFGTTAKGTGTLAGQDLAEEGWTKAGVGALTFTPAPASPRHGVFLGELLTSDVMAQGKAVGGVRFVPEDGKDATVDSATVNNWASRCGLSGLRGVVSGADVASAVGASRSVDALTGWGEAGGVVWSVTVAKGSGVSISCAPKGLYDDVDLSRYGGSLGVYLAYLENYAG